MLASSLFHDRLKMTLETRGVVPHRWAGHLSALTGKHRNAARKWLTGETKPDADALIGLATGLGIDLHYLLGIVPVLNSEKLVSLDSATVTFLAAARDSLKASPLLRSDGMPPPSTTLFQSLVVGDDDMHPVIPKGSLVFYTPTEKQELRIPAMVVIRLASGDLTIRNIVRTENTLAFQCANPRYGSRVWHRGSPPDDMNIIGHVLQTIVFTSY